MTRRDYCPDFFNPDSRFDYKKDGCGPCAHRRKPKVGIGYPTDVGFTKCRKNHTVKAYHFREEGLRKPLKKEKSFVIQVVMPKESSAAGIKEAIERLLKSEVSILMEGEGTLGAGFVDSAFFGIGELEELGFTGEAPQNPQPQEGQEEED